MTKRKFDGIIYPHTGYFPKIHLQLVDDYVGSDSVVRVLIERDKDNPPEELGIYKTNELASLLNDIKLLK